MSITEPTTEMQEEVEKFANEIEAIDIAQRIVTAAIRSGASYHKGSAPFVGDFMTIAEKLSSPEVTDQDRDNAVELILELSFHAIEDAGSVAAAYVKKLNYAGVLAELNPLGDNSFVKSGYELGITFSPTKEYSIVATAYAGIANFTVKGLGPCDEELVAELGVSKTLIQYLDAQ